MVKESHERGPSVEQEEHRQESPTATIIVHESSVVSTQNRVHGRRSELTSLKMITIGDLILEQQHRDKTSAMQSHNTSKTSSTDDFNATLGPSTPRSSSIPLPSSHVHRTESEVQLFHDQAAAEERDLNMFYRLVNGIRKRQLHGQSRQNEDPSSIPALPRRVIDESPTEAATSAAVAWYTPNGPVLPLQTQQVPPMGPSSSWSITGSFGYCATNDPFSSNLAGPPPAPTHSQEDQQDADNDDALLEEDEGVFTMDL